MFLYKYHMVVYQSCVYNISLVCTNSIYGGITTDKAIESH